MTPKTLTKAAGSQEAAERLLNKTVVLELHIKTPTFRAAMGAADLMADSDKADAERFSVNKRLIDKEALSELYIHRSRFLGWLFARRVACSILSSGMHLVPLRMAEEIWAAIETYKQERTALVEKLLDRYDELVEAARKALAAHFNEDDYPDKAELRDAFGVRARFLSLNVPAALKEVNDEIYKRECARIQAEWAEAAVEVKDAMRVGFAQLVGKLADRLEPDTDGKPKTFRASTVENLNQFLSIFDDRNITNDTQLAALVTQAKGLLAGVDPKQIRQEEKVRTNILRGFERIGKALTKMGVEVKQREFAGDDEEV